MGIEHSTALHLNHVGTPAPSERSALLATHEEQFKLINAQLARLGMSPIVEGQLNTVAFDSLYHLAHHVMQRTDDLSVPEEQGYVREKRKQIMLIIQRG